MDDCMSQSDSINASSTKQQLSLVSHSILHSLTQQWPSLPALLLSGATQRLCQLSQQQHQHTQLHDASVLASWVKLLLDNSQTGDTHRQQHPESPGVSRVRKRKSSSSDAKRPPSAEGNSFNPTAPQLQACTAECFAALPASSHETAGAVRQVVLQLLSRLQEDHQQEYASWGSSAQTLVDLNHPQQDGSSVQTAASSFDLHDAQQMQQALLDDMKASDDGNSRSVSALGFMSACCLLVQRSSELVSTVCNCCSKTLYSSLAQ